jgi:hypothetical protein
MARFKKLTKEDARYSAAGTSLKGYLKTGIQFTDLYQTLGEPTFKPEDSGDGKIQYEWVIEYKGDIFTIYDWKTYDERYTVEEYDRWHVGGKVYSGDFEDLIEQLVKKKTHA